MTDYREDAVELTLFSTSAERFRELKERLEEQRGIEPSTPELIRALMENFDTSERGLTHD